jgi:uncharacterized protein YutE (UPF0331/DUF86 family)
MMIVEFYQYLENLKLYEILKNSFIDVKNMQKLVKKFRLIFDDLKDILDYL